MSTPVENSENMQTMSGCTLEHYSESKQLPVSFLEGLGLTQITYMGAPAVRIPYRDQDGAIIATRFRTAMEKGEDYDNRFRWKNGTKPIPYGIWRRNRAIEAGYIILVEGESDAQTLWLHGFPALGIPGANSWKEEWADYFENILRIYVFIEPDSGGDAVLSLIGKSKIRDRVEFIHLEGYKDPSDLHLKASERFKDRIEDSMRTAVSWKKQWLIKKDTDKKEYWEKCGHLARESNILDRFIMDLKRTGVVGEERNSRLLFLVLVSRYLERPVSVIIKGPSSTGKSYMMDQVLKFFPENVYYKVTAMSEKALLYSDISLSHRFLVIAEAVGLDNEFMAYIVRSLLSEGKLNYPTVEKTTEGLKARIIECEGPTGLIVTTTKINLHPENETRMLSIQVSDSIDQTRKICLAIAHQQNTTTDYSQWHALQRWLDQANHSVVIPYATALAKSITYCHVRQRRDFTQLLNLIIAHTILHQANREIDAEGRIISTLEDYAAVRDLIVDSMGEIIEATVSDETRETVNAVNELLKTLPAGVTIKALTERLKLDRSAVYRRVNGCLDKGYLQNVRERGQRPMMLIPGDPLPEDVEILPTAEALESCFVASERGGYDTPPVPIDQSNIRQEQENGVETAVKEYPWRDHLIN
ncbi:hypothetical protein JXO52_14020 [bacterium]|nr:hypothetical protein [bacterium]